MCCGRKPKGYSRYIERHVSVKMDRSADMRILMRQHKLLTLNAIRDRFFTMATAQR